MAAEDVNDMAIHMNYMILVARYADHRVMSAKYLCTHQ